MNKFIEKLKNIDFKDKASVKAYSKELLENYNSRSKTAKYSHTKSSCFCEECLECIEKSEGVVSVIYAILNNLMEFLNFLEDNLSSPLNLIPVLIMSVLTFPLDVYIPLFGNSYDDPIVFYLAFFISRKFFDRCIDNKCICYNLSTGSLFKLLCAMVLLLIVSVVAVLLNFISLPQSVVEIIGSILTVVIELIHSYFSNSLNFDMLKYTEQDCNACLTKGCFASSG